jgi:hypothetical protein
MLRYLLFTTNVDKYFISFQELIVDTIKNFIDELDAIVPARSKDTVIESRATHLIASAINLVRLIRESYPEEQADDLVKRLHRSIMSEDERKFTRKIK